MFEGSYSLPKMEHARLVQGNGGTMNGSTRTDYTNYFEELPSSALELGLFLEADRMRAVRLDDETLANQIAVVKEEIRVNVLNRPYGGFPWIDLPPVMFDTFNNAHNGYGSFVDLDAATVEDAADFFDRYYSPANAVLCVAGDTTTEQVHELAERHFGIVDPRPAPVLPSFHEPIRPAAEQRHVAQVDPQAPTPALAAAWRVPDPIGQLEEYLACVVLVEVLTSGDTSRLHRRLVRDDRLVTQVDGMLGTFGDPFDVRDPTMLQLMAYHLDGSQAPAILDAIDEEVADVAGGLDHDEVDRVVTTLVAGGFRSDDHVMHRSLTMAVLEQQRGRAELLSELPGLVMAVTPDEVSAAAATWLGATGRAVLRVEAGAAR